MSKPKHINGQDIINDLDIEPFQLLNDHIKQGLQPYNELGQPLSPRDIIEMLHPIDAWEGHEEWADGFDTLEIKNKIREATERIEAVGDIDWQDFQLPKANEGKAVLDELLRAIYLQEEIGSIEKPAQKAKDVEEVADIEKPETHRDKCERRCIEIAKQYWAIDPTIHPAILAYADEITQVAVKKNGDMFSTDKIADWIRPYWSEEHKHMGPPKKEEIGFTLSQKPKK